MKAHRTFSRFARGALLAFLMGLPLLSLPKSHPAWTQELAEPGQEASRVVVAPFRITSTEDVSYLSSGLADMLSSRLATYKDITVLDQSALSASAVQQLDKGMIEPESARAVGEEANADHVILGNFLQAAEGMVLEATIVNVAADQPPVTVSYPLRAMSGLMGGIGVLAERIHHKMMGIEVIAEISIRGNRLIEDDAILYQIPIKPGDVFSPEKIKNSIQAIYEMGFFSDIQVDSSDDPRGKKITFIVQENPEIAEIRLTGNKEVNTDDLRKEIDLAPHTILDYTKAKENALKLKRFYRGKGYYNALVDYSVEPVGEDRVALTFSVVEHHPMKIKEISFKGNEHLSTKNLKKVMETREKGLFSFFTDSGLFKDEALQQDLDRIRALYYDHGYMDVKVADPEVTHDDEWIYITVPVEEGPQYKVSFVNLAGDLIESEEKLRGLIKLAPGQIFSRTTIRDDITALTDVYGDRGYAFADVTPLTNINADDRTIGVTYDIAPGKKVFFEDITITGNTRTRDKVVRRELRFKEEELYSNNKLQKSRERLNNLGYFEEVNINTAQGSTPEKIDVQVQVKEKPTGMISVGAGYSSVDNLIGMFQVSQDNFLGKGLRAQLMAQLGSNNRFRLGITNPYLFDKEISAGFNIFKVDLEYEDFDSSSTGFDTSLAVRPFGWEDWSLGFKYELSEVDISNIDVEPVIPINPCDPNDPNCQEPVEDLTPSDIDTWVSDADLEIWESEGTTSVSSMTTSLSRNTIDNRFYPMRGSLNSLSVQLAGGPFFGPSKFYKLILDSKWFFPFKWETAFMARGALGYTKGFAGSDVPVFERFFLGGLDSLRGFDYRSVGPKGDVSTITETAVDPVTGEVYERTITLTGDAVTGGNKMILFNFEYLFPLVKAAKIRGLVFFDIGNAYGEDESYDLGNLRESVGWGIRWNSPFGPLRVEWGYVLDPEEDEESSQFEFSVGTAF